MNYRNESTQSPPRDFVFVAEASASRIIQAEIGRAHV